MDFHETRARIVEARKKGEFTDFTFICEGGDIQVHRIIICSQSPVFRAACAGQFKEAQSGTYNLMSDHPDMVQLMVDYLYTGDYSVDIDGTSEEDAGYASTALSIHAVMYSLGDKYDIEGLRNVSTKKYCTELHGTLSTDDFFSSIPFVYGLTPENSRDLRDPVLAFARNLLGGEGPTTLGFVREAMDELFIECPEFVKELLYSLLQTPLMGYCPCTGTLDMVPVEARECRCRKCGKNGASLRRP
ncbi:unnamed protein product [Fusarium graminearum]|uniref:Uncharacterized protein n=1 Tax=Gibberella zeae TaxID=5518 RepID=A0A4U9F8Z1_GIBZA|nr:hypothetical protein FG05_12360 [Fusarium graminearum]CAG1960134.1 unnamed protein product [Fusarium graminearum]CAG1971066.1 unnamed protein product [Fusarium graminearum]VTO89957.1 unnamed protein product [Fusarium graminearum]